MSEEKSYQSHLTRQWHLAMNFGWYHAHVRVGSSVRTHGSIANLSSDARHCGDEVGRSLATQGLDVCSRAVASPGRVLFEYHARQMGVGNFGEKRRIAIYHAGLLDVCPVAALATGGDDEAMMVVVFDSVLSVVEKMAGPLVLVRHTQHPTRSILLAKTVVMRPHRFRTGILRNLVDSHHCQAVRAEPWSQSLGPANGPFDPALRCGWHMFGAVRCNIMSALVNAGMPWTLLTMASSFFLSSSAVVRFSTC